MQNDIQHTGVLGMRWGHRKGSSGSSVSSSKPKKPSVKDMSDDDLKKAVNRLNMEKQYTKLTSEDVSRGKNFAKKYMAVAASAAAATTTAITLYNNAGKIKAIMETSAGSKTAGKVANFAAKHLNKGVDKDIAGAFMKF